MSGCTHFHVRTCKKLFWICVLWHLYLQQPAESANPTQCTMMQFAAINCTIRSDDWRQQHYKNLEYSIGNEIAYLDLHEA